MIRIERALSIRQPWVWAMLYAGKRIENRTWATSYRGPLYLHAAQALASKESRRAFHAIAAQLGIDVPALEIFPRGALIATAELIDCTQNVPRGQHPWADSGAHYFVLANIAALAEPIPLDGALGLWRVPPEIARMRAMKSPTSHATSQCSRRSGRS